MRLEPGSRLTRHWHRGCCLQGPSTAFAGGAGQGEEYSPGQGSDSLVRDYGSRLVVVYFDHVANGENPQVGPNSVSET